MLTYAGAALGAVIIGWYGYQWWRAGRKFKALLVTILAPVAVGGLLVALPGGLLGKTADVASSGTNTVGGVVAGGAGGLDGTIVAGETAPLTKGAVLVTLALLAVALGVVVTSAKGGGKAQLVQLVLMAVAGIALARSAGGADMLNGTLYAWLNDAGQPVDDWLNGRSS